MHLSNTNQLSSGPSPQGREGAGPAWQEKTPEPPKATLLCSCGQLTLPNSPCNLYHRNQIKYQTRKTVRRYVAP